MRSVLIRKAEPADARLLAELAYEAWEQGILPLLTENPGMRDAERHRLRRAVAETLTRIIVAEQDGYPVGWCSRSARRTYIPFLFVAPDNQGQGIGSMLLRRMETILELAGADRVHLETPADHIRAVRFYERQGYRILAMRPDGRAVHEAFMSVHLEKKLHPFEGDLDDED
jgi:ribosomal-protein-alanine N-acetyltransferase